MDAEIATYWFTPVPQPLATALLAPMFLGWSLQLLLNGVAFRMAFAYCAGVAPRFSQDSRTTRFIVCGVTGLLVGCTVISMFQIIKVGSSQERGLGGIWTYTIASVLQPLLMVLISCLVQFSYSQKTVAIIETRVGKWAFTIVVGALMGTSFVTALLGTMKELGYLYGFEEHLRFVVYDTLAIWLCTSAAVDIAISTALGILLSGKVEGFRESTDNVLRKLVYLAVETASYTAISAFVGAPVLFGWCFQMILAGLAFRMGYEYWTRGRYSQDTKANKVLLWSVMFLLLVVTVIDMQGVISLGSTQDRALGGIWNFTVQSAILPGLTVFISTIMQISYARKVVFLINGKRSKVAFLVIIGSMITVSFVFAILTVVSSIGYIYGYYLKMLPISPFNSAGVWLWCSAGADICISIALCVLLTQQLRGNNGFRAKTDQILKKLVVLTVKTASYTTIFAVVGAMTSVICVNMDVADISNAFFAPLPSLYAIALCVSLDSRGRLGEEMRDVPENSTLPLSMQSRNSHQISMTASRPGGPQRQPSQYSVCVRQEVAVKVDREEGEKTEYSI
ncbi:hypothetical protein T439DRAFT_376662 [Meredithblackwellia eburnea MCA 4105]